MLIKLTEQEKDNYCVKLSESLNRLREIVGFTQEDLASLSGISKERISRIENGSNPMRWAQFVNFIMVFTMNVNAKEYLIASGILSSRLLQAFQMKDDLVPPDLIVQVSEPLNQMFNADFEKSYPLNSTDAEKSN